MIEPGGVACSPRPSTKLTEHAYNVPSPEEVSTVLKEAEAAGGSIRRAAAAMDWGGTSGAFADPEGYVWEVAHNPNWSIDENGKVHM